MGKGVGAGFQEYEYFQSRLDSAFSDRNGFLLPIFITLRREIPEKTFFFFF
jgi:hypothetical protein